LVFTARTYGGNNTAENTITVSISTDNGSSWTVLGARRPTSTSLVAQQAFDLSSYNGTQVKNGKKVRTAYNFPITVNVK
jgi:hypothetical protein